MKSGQIAIICLFILTGCATHGTKLLPAPPLPSESIGLYLEAESRSGTMGACYTICCNVSLHNLNNTSIPIWNFPRTIFYAEQSGQFYVLSLIEKYSGGISSPYRKTGISVTLPRPPRAGKWNIFATQEHSDLVYQRHLLRYPPKFPLVNVEDQDKKYGGMWTKPLLSNTITVEFAEIDQDELKLAEDTIQSMIKAGNYKPEFREPTNDPRKKSSIWLFRRRSSTVTHP